MKEHQIESEKERKNYLDHLEEMRIKNEEHIKEHQLLAEEERKRNLEHLEE